jgi:hypothetical protein
MRLGNLPGRRHLEPGKLGFPHDGEARQGDLKQRIGVLSGFSPPIHNYPILRRIQFVLWQCVILGIRKTVWQATVGDVRTRLP